MKHDWRESYNADCTAIIFTCGRCDARIAVMKSRCNVHSPDEDEELLEKNRVSLDCDVQVAKRVMES